MKELFSLFKYAFFNVLRAKWLIFYALFFTTITSALLNFGGEASKVTASILNIILLLVPLVSILYGSIHWYNGEPFSQLLLTQPLRRSTVYLAQWLAISCGLAGSFLGSIFFSLAIFRLINTQSLFILFIGTLLTFIFVGIGLLVAVLINDRMKGLGLVILSWLYFSLIHDLVVFILIANFSEYPIEVPSILLMLLNPIDLARLAILLSIDLSAMMGYTGRILQELLSRPSGMAFAIFSLGVWTIFPVFFGVRYFSKKDL